MAIGDMTDAARWKGSSPESLVWLGRLLQEEGVDLLSADELQLKRGTPVYVDGGADVVDVQRLMARFHIRMLPVVEEGKVTGLVDLVELAQTLGGLDDDASGLQIRDVAGFS